MNANQAEGATAPLSAAFEPLTYDEEPQFYRWEDGLRDYIGRVNAWRAFRALTEEKATLQRERDKAETTLEMINALATGYGWLSEGRGSYEWDDGRYDDDVRLFTSQLLELLPSGNWLGFPEWEAQYRRLEAEVTGLRAALEDMVHECDRTIAWRKGGVRPATDTSIFSASALSSVIKVRRAFVAALGDAPQPASEPAPEPCRVCGDSGVDAQGYVCDCAPAAVDIARMAGKGDGRNRP